MKKRVRVKVKCVSCDNLVEKNYMKKEPQRCGDCYHKSRLGSHRSEETKRKIGLGHFGEKSYIWKGDNVGYGPLHRWVRKIFPKKELCECCGKVPPIDLANKGVYNRDPKNWEWLCRKCHMTKDGRMNNLKQYQKEVAKCVQLSWFVSVEKSESLDNGSHHH